MIDRHRHTTCMRRRLRQAVVAAPRQSARLLLAAVVGLTAVVAVNSARAGSEASQARPTLNSWRSQQKSVDKADLEDMKRTMNLDDDQVEIIGVLIEGYELAFDEGMKEIREETSRIREEARQRNREGGMVDPQLWSDIGNQVEAMYAEWAVTAEKLESDLFGDVKSVLTEEQVRSWPKYERERRRRTTLTRNTRLSYEGIDLIALLHGLEFEPEVITSVESTLEAYANELDQALIERNRVVEESENKLRELAETQRFDEAETYYKQAFDRRIAVGQVNERYAQLLESQLEREASAKFRQAVLETAFPRIYRPSQAERYADYVRSLDDLTDDQRASVDRLVDNFKQQAEPINEALVQNERQRELEPPPTFVQHGRVSGGATSSSTAMGGGRPQSQQVARQLWAERRKLEQNLMEQVFDGLTEEQKVRAPRGRTQAPRNPSELAP